MIMPTNFALHFITKTRHPVTQASTDDGEPYTTLAETRPDWLLGTVREAHQGTLPSGWIYEECRAAVEAFDAGDLDDSDSVHEHADGRVDVYTRALYQWAADFCTTETFAAAEQEARDMGLPEETEKRIACIQYAAIRHIADTMREACIKAAKATETEPAYERKSKGGSHHGKAQPS
jgi:hypothetical protein